jgi:hypothetical protein
MTQASEPRTELSSVLVENLKRHIPTIKENIAIKWAKSYVKSVVNQIKIQNSYYGNPIFYADGDLRCFMFSHTYVYDTAGQASVLGKSIRTKVLFDQFPDTRLVDTLWTGNSITGELSDVRLNPVFSQLLQLEINMSNIPVDFFQKQREAKNDPTNIPVPTPVMLNYLLDYIAYTENTLKGVAPFKVISDRDSAAERSFKARTNAFRRKIVDNLEIARVLVDMGIKEDGKGGHYSDEYWKEIDNGRLYGCGLNLQSMSKVVREAALGPAFKYDFAACCYTALTNLAVDILADEFSKDNFKLSYSEFAEFDQKRFFWLRDYATNRTQIRERVARETGISVKSVKTAFTMIGFGAKLQVTPKGVNGEAIGAMNRELCANEIRALEGNDTFMRIYNQFREATSIILKSERFKGDTFELYGRTYKSVDSNGKKRNKSQKVAWIYQCIERQALDALYDHATAQKVEVLLLVHDCIYTRQEIHAPNDACYKMGDRNGLNIRNMRVSKEESKVFGKGFRSKQRILGEVEQHKALIEEQEKLAREYKGLSATTSGDSGQRTKYVKVFVAGCEIQMPADLVCWI